MNPVSIRGSSAEMIETYQSRNLIETNILWG